MYLNLPARTKKALHKKCPQRTVRTKKAIPHLSQKKQKNRIKKNLNQENGSSSVHMGGWSVNFSIKNNMRSKSIGPLAFEHVTF